MIVNSAHFTNITLISGFCKGDFISFTFWVTSLRTSYTKVLMALFNSPQLLLACLFWIYPYQDYISCTWSYNIWEPCIILKSYQLITFPLYCIFFHSACQQIWELPGIYHFLQNMVIYPSVWRIMHNSCYPRFKKTNYTYTLVNILYIGCH